MGNLKPNGAGSTGLSQALLGRSHRLGCGDLLRGPPYAQFVKLCGFWYSCIWVPPYHIVIKPQCSMELLPIEFGTFLRAERELFEKPFRQAVIRAGEALSHVEAAGQVQRSLTGLHQAPEACLPSRRRVNELYKVISAKNTRRVGNEYELTGINAIQKAPPELAVHEKSNLVGV
jgi:hypothetical protein